jgi:hypothetical protein
MKGAPISICMTCMITVRALLASLSLLMTAACDGTFQPLVDASRCEEPDYQAALPGNIDEVQIWAGNQTALAPEPLLVSVDQEKIASIAEFFLDRRDHWYIAAGETYDPATRRSGSEFTLRFMSAGREQAYIGWGYAYLESHGCGFEVVRPLSPPDRSGLMRVVFDVPLRQRHVE